MNRRRAWIVGLGLLVGGPWFGFLGDHADGAAPANWADKLFSESGHNFGPVPRGGIVRHPFVLTNRLDEPITIVDVQASCGCTTGWADLTVVPPGQRAIVEAQLNTREFSGPKKTVLFVTLMTANGRQAEARLTISSLILSDIVLNPGTIDFGAVTRGQSPELTLSIDRLGPPGWRIERAQMTGDAMVGSVSLLSEPQAETTRYGIRVRLKPDVPIGILREEVRLLTNDPEARVISIPVNAQVLGNVSISPSLVSLGPITSDHGAQGRVIVRGQRPFAITKILGEGDGVRLEAPDQGQTKPLHILTVHYDPTEGTTRGDLQRAFHIVTDLPGEPPLEVKATARINP